MDALDARSELRSGRREDVDQLIPVVYDHLRAIAHRQLGLQQPGATLSTTGLIHEAYLKLVDQSRHAFRDRAHFMALASVAMRHVLVDLARARRTKKRDGGRRVVTLEQEQIAAAAQPEAMLEINEAVEQLAKVEPRLAQVVECRFFGGLTEEETAEALGVTVRTVQRDWVKARMLLRRALLDPPETGGKRAAP